MINVAIHQSACRGCQLCIDVCPTNVLAFDSAIEQAIVSHAEDCIGCLSCAYMCPSGAVTHTDHHVVKNFYRDLEFCDRMERFL